MKSSNYITELHPSDLKTWTVNIELGFSRSSKVKKGQIYRGRDVVTPNQ